MAESGRDTVPASDSAVGIKTLVLVTFSTTAGVMVEFYDFFLYGYAAAVVFPKLFFPNLPFSQALVLLLGVRGRVPREDFGRVHIRTLW